MKWKVPYLHIDPADIGRKYERLIRINSQSGKGGIAWVLDKDYGIDIPKFIQPELGEYVQDFSESVGREISSEEVYSIFEKNYMDIDNPYTLIRYWPRPDDDDPTLIHGEVHMKIEGKKIIFKADGNGPISAFVSAIRKKIDFNFSVEDYHEQAIGKGANAKALAFVPIKLDDREIVYGGGIDSNIDQAAVKAIISGLNRYAQKLESY